MTNPIDERESEWIQSQVRREEALGLIVPGGAQGGVVARSRREGAARSRAKTAAVLRARDRVRWTFRALDEDEAA